MSMRSGQAMDALSCPEAAPERLAHVAANSAASANSNSNYETPTLNYETLKLNPDRETRSLPGETRTA